MLPSGFARSLTRPEATGSGTTVKTIGIVSVAAFAARAATAPLAKMRSTRAFVSSSAAVDTALRSPRVNRMSKLTSRPSCIPSCVSPARSPSTIGALGASAVLTTPIRNRFAVCAGVSSGSIDAVPRTSRATASGRAGGGEFTARRYHAPSRFRIHPSARVMRVRREVPSMSGRSGDASRHWSLKDAEQSVDRPFQTALDQVAAGAVGLVALAHRVGDVAVLAGELPEREHGPRVGSGEGPELELLSRGHRQDEVGGGDHLRVLPEGRGGNRGLRQVDPVLAEGQAPL